MPFQSLRKSLKKNFNKIINNIKYGDANRLPLDYIPTYSREKSSDYYAFPMETKDEPLSSYQSFPKLSKEILVTLFWAIGVEYVPEVVLYELKSKTPQKAFQDFCFTFGLEDENIINSRLLNQVIKRLMEMDKFRQTTAWNSRGIYKALANRDLNEADRLINEMREKDK